MFRKSLVFLLFVSSCLLVIAQQPKPPDPAADIARLDRTINRTTSVTAFGERVRQALWETAKKELATGKPTTPVTLTFDVSFIEPPPFPPHPAFPPKSRCVQFCPKGGFPCTEACPEDDGGFVPGPGTGVIPSRCDLLRRWLVSATSSEEIVSIVGQLQEHNCLKATEVVSCRITRSRQLTPGPIAPHP